MTQRKVKSFKTDEVPVSQMILRMVDVQRERVDVANKSVPVVIASETPVERFDQARGDVYAEILDMNGVRFRTERKQLPIVDSHDRSTVRNVLGSVRNIRVEGSQLVGDATFARDGDSQVAFEKLVDGHLTDFSITATPVAARQIKRGEASDFNGGTVNGPAVIITEWTPTDASLVAAGADSTSTVRELMRSYETQNRKVQRMLSEELKAALVAKGMPEQLSTPEEAMAWAVGVIGTIQGPEVPEVVPDPVAASPVESAMDAPADDKPKDEPADDAKPEDEDIEKAVKRALDEDRKRQKEILALCQQAKIERAFADDLCESGATIDKARHKILERMMADNQPVGSSVRVEITADSTDKFNKAMGDALVQRALSAANSQYNPFDGGKPAAGSEDFRYMGLMRMAEDHLRRSGINTSRLAPRDIAMIALGDVSTMYRHGIARDAYHTTGSFANLMLNAANKTLLAGYEESQPTWMLWASQGPSAPDTKTINRIRFSESPDLVMIPELHDYPEAAMSDAKESYKPEKFGRIFSVSWETVVNDDLDALSRIPNAFGAAARRVQNKKVYEVLTSNPTMGDGQALFSASHASGDNTSGAAAAPSVTTLNAAFTKMALQKGLNSGVTLNLVPKFLIVPAAYAATAEELVSSMSYNASNNNSGVKNIYGPGGMRPITVVADSVLDASSATVWYMATATSQCATVELTFLQGEETPVLETDWQMKKDAYEFKVRQTFGVKAIDWRGLYRNSA